MKLKFQTVTGMRDWLPEDYKYLQKFQEKASELASFYGFQRIETPILEDTELFAKGTGRGTDLVQKEMFSLKTKGGDALSLRPEGTPAIVRSYLENGLSSRPQPTKLFYFGPFFRYERPQAGRYRQFYQFGLEVFGEQNEVMDVQIIQIGYQILKELGIKKVMVDINNIENTACRSVYRKALVRYLRQHSDNLCADCKRRLKENPLRILDCKKEKCQEIIQGAPQTLDHLCADCRKSFKKTLEFMDDAEIPYRLNPHLVRGLDYYNQTVFEFFTEDNNLALGGGGRYDDLIKTIGGKETPAVGMAFGVDRIIDLMKEKELKDDNDPIVFLAQLGDTGRGKALKLMEELRKARISVAECLGRDSLKMQLTRAGRLKAKFCLILGQQEAINDTIIIRNMSTGAQETVKMDKVVEKIKKKK